MNGNTRPDLDAVAPTTGTWTSGPPRARRRFRAELLARWKQLRKASRPSRRRPGSTCRGSPCRRPTSPARSPATFRRRPARRVPVREGGLSARCTSTQTGGQPAEEPTRLFAGLGLAEDTNARFHFLTKQQRHGPAEHRLRRADALRPGLRRRRRASARSARAASRSTPSRTWSACTTASRSTTTDFSASMTINGPAPIDPRDVRRRGQAPLRARRGRQAPRHRSRRTSSRKCRRRTRSSSRSRRRCGSWATWSSTCTTNMPRWYPISISGYHIAEAGATPVQQAAYTLSNGFTYVELFRSRGMDVNEFGPRLSFFLDCGLDVEYLALARVCRQDLGDRHARRLRRRRAGAALQAAHADQRPVARRPRVQEQPDPHRGRADAGVHELDQLLPQQQRGRAVHDAVRGVRAARGPRAGDPAGGVGAVQARDEPAERLAGHAGRRAGGGGRGARRVPRDRPPRRRARRGRAPLPAQPDPGRRPSIRAADLRRHPPDHRPEPLPRRHRGPPRDTDRPDRPEEEAAPGRPPRQVQTPPRPRRRPRRWTSCRKWSRGAATSSSSSSRPSSTARSARSRPGCTSWSVITGRPSNPQSSSRNPSPSPATPLPRVGATLLPLPDVAGPANDVARHF